MFNGCTCGLKLAVSLVSVPCGSPPTSLPGPSPLPMPTLALAAFLLVL